MSGTTSTCKNSVVRCRILLLAAPLLLSWAWPLASQERRITHLHLSAMNAWIYNGFTETEGGEPVQGSDVSPINVSFGAGATLPLTAGLALEPELWLYLQEYIALDAFDKVVPTQIETGPAVGEIARTVTTGVSVPVAVRMRFGEDSRFGATARAGAALLIRIPYRAIEGSDTAPITRYWLTRFLYPLLGLGLDMRVSDRVFVGADVDWFVPLYNAWDQDVETPFLDEQILRYGIRIRWTTVR